jgi:hypothetical protein
MWKIAEWALRLLGLRSKEMHDTRACLPSVETRDQGACDEGAYQVRVRRQDRSGFDWIDLQGAQSFVLKRPEWSGAAMPPELSVYHLLPSGRWVHEVGFGPGDSAFVDSTPQQVASDFGRAKYKEWPAALEPFRRYTDICEFFRWMQYQAKPGLPDHDRVTDNRTATCSGCGELTYLRADSCWNCRRSLDPPDLEPLFEVLNPPRTPCFDSPPGLHDVLNREGGGATLPPATPNAKRPGAPPVVPEPETDLNTLVNRYLKLHPGDKSTQVAKGVQDRYPGATDKAVRNTEAWRNRKALRLRQGERRNRSVKTVPLSEAGHDGLLDNCVSREPDPADLAELVSEQFDEAETDRSEYPPEPLPPTEGKLADKVKSFRTRRQSG